MAKNVINSKSDPDDIYNFYSGQYDKKEGAISTRFGADMYSAKLDKRSFKLMLNSYRQDDKKSSLQTIVNRMVNDQSSKMTKASILHIQQSPDSIQFLRENGIKNFSQDSLRYDPKVADVINKAYHKFIDEGVSVLEAKHLISNLVFGSP